MTETKVNTFFVSEKISKVRWLPEHLKESECFITGSWDMPKNFVRIWRLQKNRYADDYVPQCTGKVEFEGDISGLEIVSNDIVAASCSNGVVTLLKHTRTVEMDNLEVLQKSPVLHNFNTGDRAAPCTGISVYNKDIATVGEDGRLNIIDAATLQNVYRTVQADSCALTSVAYVNVQEVFTANRMGVIRMFDVRTSADSTNPITSFMVSREDDKSSNYVSCLVSHPTQSHILLAGSEEGSITVWDLRQPGYAASYISAHTSAITEISFHRADPTHLFTAAEWGELWMWSQQPSMNVVHNGMGQTVENVNPWLSGERAKSRISATSLISGLRKSINSFDSNGSKIICGSDSEAVFLIDNVF